jgi:hypothetical protein
MRSRRTLQLIAALEKAGHTNVGVWWEPVGPAVEMCGQSGGYFFASTQHEGINPLGLSLKEALATLKRYPVKKAVRTPANASSIARARTRDR